MASTVTYPLNDPGPNNEAAISGGRNFLNVRQMLRLLPFSPPLEQLPRRNDLAIQ